MKIRKLKAKDMERVISQADRFMLRSIITPVHILSQEMNLFSFTIFHGEEPVACVGVQEYWPGRGEAWAVLSRKASGHLLGITRAVQELLSKCPVRRVEMSVERDFCSGHRWAEMLGFKKEAECLKAFFTNGKDASLYARVRHG